MKYILLTLMVFGSFGAIADDSLFIDPNNPEPWVETPENIPIINEETTVYLGDRMLLQRRGLFKQCLESKIDLTVTMGNMWEEDRDYSIKIGDVICNRKKPLSPSCDGCYIDQKTKVINWISEKRKKISYSRDGWELKKFTKDEFKASFKPVVRYEVIENTLQRSLEYAGKNGNLLKFIYSEFKDNLARDAFTREFQIDLNEGSTGAYKGAVFEILNADNASVTYKIIRHFPEQST